MFVIHTSRAHGFHALKSDSIINIRKISKQEALSIQEIEKYIQCDKIESMVFA